MDTVFDPDSIAVIGASSDPTRIAGRPIRFLKKHGYQGDIFPVNPNHDTLAGLSCYPDIQSVPQTPEFAMVILPAGLVVDIVEDCISEGVDTVLIVSSGFAETGSDDGKVAEQTLGKMADESETTIIGPNSQGLLNVPERISASFTPALRREKMIPGPVSFVSQSGAFGGALTTILQDNDVGIDKWVSTGNEAAVESLDFMSVLAENATTDIIAGYIEGFEDGRKLIELKRTTDGINTPIVVLKAGRSARGKEAAQSHTGKVAGQHAVYEGMFEEFGVLNTRDIDHFVDVIKSLSILESFPGPNLGVVTTSGGAGIHIADVVADERAIHLPQLSDNVQNTLGEYVPEFGSTFNPVDITAQVVNSPESFQACLEHLRDAPEIDTVVLQSTNASGERALGYAETVTDVAEESEKPIFVIWTGGVEKSEALAIYRSAGIPVFENPARCINTISSIVQFARSRKPLTKSQALPARVSETKSPSTETSTYTVEEFLDEADAKSLLASTGLSIPDEQVVTSARDAVEAADIIGYPVVAKILSRDVPHRNEIGGVITDLESPASVRRAYESLSAIGTERQINIRGVAIQDQVHGQDELALGIVTDTDFGPVIMLGRGGVDIEEIEDITFRSIPVHQSTAERMIESLETINVQSLTSTQHDSVVDNILALSDAYTNNPWITEVDVNPLIITEEGSVAVDALVYGPEA